MEPTGKQGRLTAKSRNVNDNYKRNIGFRIDNHFTDKQTSFSCYTHTLFKSAIFNY